MQNPLLNDLFIFFSSAQLSRFKSITLRSKCYFKIHIFIKNSKHRMTLYFSAIITIFIVQDKTFSNKNKIACDF